MFHETLPNSSIWPRKLSATSDHLACTTKLPSTMRHRIFQLNTCCEILANQRDAFHVSIKRLQFTISPIYNCGLLVSLPGKLVSLYASMTIFSSCIVRTPIANTKFIHSYGPSLASNWSLVNQSAWSCVILDGGGALFEFIDGSGLYIPFDRT